MDADEIQPLTRESAATLAAAQQPSSDSPDESGKRTQPRWPFPGAVELWLPSAEGAEIHALGACHNLSRTGIGVRCDHQLSAGLTLPLAIHLPQASYYGKGVVRHCSERGKGFLVGIEFVFDD